MSLTLSPKGFWKVFRTDFKLSLLFKPTFKKRNILGFRGNFFSLKDKIHERLPKLLQQNFGSELYCSEKITLFLWVKTTFCNFKVLFYFHRILKSFPGAIKPDSSESKFCSQRFGTLGLILSFKMAMLLSKQACLVRESIFENLSLQFRF